MQHTYTVNIEHDVYRYFLTTKEYHQGTLNTPCSAERILTSCLYRIIRGIYLDSHGWSVDVLYSAAYTFIDIWRAIPATKLLATSSYKLGFYRYGWGSRTFRNITIDSTYVLIQGWLSMTQLLLEHSWRSHYNGQGKADDFPLKMKAYLGNSPKHFVVQAGKLLRAPKKPLEMVSLTINTKACSEEYLPT